eukprot:2002380-Amphidinium_carterae.1
MSRGLGGLVLDAEARRLRQVDRPLAPWERGWIGRLLGTELRIDPWALPANPSLPIAPAGAADPAVTPAERPAKRFKPMRTVPTDDETRSKAVSVWVNALARNLHDSRLGDEAANDNPQERLGVFVEEALACKRSATVMKRAYSMQQFLDWADEREAAP